MIRSCALIAAQACRPVSTHSTILKAHLGETAEATVDLAVGTCRAGPLRPAAAATKSPLSNCRLSLFFWETGLAPAHEPVPGQPPPVAGA